MYSNERIRRARCAAATAVWVMLLAAGPSAAGDESTAANPGTRESPVAASQAGPLLGALTLRDALALALERSPEFASFSWEIRAREARALQAG